MRSLEGAEVGMCVGAIWVILVAVQVAFMEISEVGMWFKEGVAMFICGYVGFCKSMN